MAAMAPAPATNEVNTPNKHNNAWLPLCMGWLGETLDFTL